MNFLQYPPLRTSQHTIPLIDKEAMLSSRQSSPDFEQPESNFQLSVRMYPLRYNTSLYLSALYSHRRLIDCRHPRRFRKLSANYYIRYFLPGQQQRLSARLHHKQLYFMPTQPPSYLLYLLPCFLFCIDDLPSTRNSERKVAIEFRRSLLKHNYPNIHCLKPTQRRGHCNM